MLKNSNDRTGTGRKQGARPIDSRRQAASRQPKTNTVISGEANVDRVSIANEQHGKIEFAIPPDRIVSPPLSHLSANSVRGRYGLYGYDVDFVGRHQELAELRRFLEYTTESPCDFAWWLWIAPGGQGKSRLASHLYLEAENDGWDCGFLSSIDEFSGWDDWVVINRTLIIIDHVASRAKQIQRAICSLARRPDNIRAPLRFLLLERSFGPNDSWVDELIPQRSAEQDRGDFFSRAYGSGGCGQFDDLSECSRVLGPIDPCEACDIFAGVLNKKGVPHPDRDIARNLLSRIDEAQRPLFVILAAEAAATSGFDQLRQWSRGDLVRFVLRREFDIWMATLKVDRLQPMSARSLRFEGHVNAVVYSTIAGPQRSQDLKETENFDVPLPDRLQSDWLHVLTGVAGESEVLVAPLAPDLLGELFVLERSLGDFGIAADTELARAHTQRLLDIAMARAPHRVIDFARRCLQDFPDHPALELFKNITIPESNIEYAYFDDYCVHMSEISQLFEKMGRWDFAEAICSRMLAYADRLTGPAELLSQRRASALYNRALARSRLQKVAEAEGDCNAALDLIETVLGSMRTLYRRGLINVRQRTLLLRASIVGRARTSEEAFGDINRILSDGDADAVTKAEALILRARLRSNGNDKAAALDDYETIIASPEPRISDQKKAAAAEARPLFWELARELGSRGLYDLALRCYDRLLSLTEGQPELEAYVRVNRSELYLRIGDFEACVLDCTDLLNADEAPEDQKQKARINRALALLLQDDTRKALRDIKEILRSVDPPGRLWASAMLLLAKAHRSQGEDSKVRKALSAIEACQDVDEDLRIIARQELAMSGKTN